MFGMKKKANKSTPEWPDLQWETKRVFRLGGYEFALPASFEEFMVLGDEVHADKFYIAKTPEIIRRYLALIAETKPRNIMELGIFRGGSTAFLQLVAKPERLLALELSSDKLDLLDRFIETDGRHKTVRVEYGVDQANTPLVRALKNDHLGPARSIDLVFDDASHLLGPTRTSFETLFPYIRPGGSFIIEDYAGTQMFITEWLDRAVEGSKEAQSLISQCLRDSVEADFKPLHLLAIEAMLASVVAPGLIRRVILDRHWIRVIRGVDDVSDPESFDLRELAKDHFSVLESELSGQIRAFMDQPT